MRRVGAPSGLRCPTCGGELAARGESAGHAGGFAMWCDVCGTGFRARRRPTMRPDPAPAPIGDVALFVRSRLLWGVLLIYRLGLGLGTVGLLIFGGFVPVLRAWLADQVAGWADVVAALGGVPIRAESVDPDADYGPVLRRAEAPALFDLLGEVAARLDVRAPEEVRLAFLPCCGAVAWGRSRALLLGLPLLSVLDVAELRSVLGHELAHLAGGDATWAARLARSVEELDRALGPGRRPGWGPLRWWALLCRRAAAALLGPIARGQEARADRAAAAVAGGRAAADALVKVALVQPLFRELLAAFDPAATPDRTLYGTFRDFWGRLPAALLDAMRLRVLTTAEALGSSPHPPVADRVAQLQAYPDRPASPADREPASGLLGDPEWIEQVLHDRLYKLQPIEPTVFHSFRG